MASNISELDFDKIRENLKNHLKSQSYFSDYDFDGSAMTAILNVLAYATHYMGVHANMAFSERFLDSAQLRSSIVSIAKELGYFPRQKQAGTATVNLQILNPSGNPASIVVPKGKEFVATGTDGKSYKFVVDSDVALTDQGGGDYNADVKLIQGINSQFRFTFDITNPKPFILEQKSIDSDYISVSVKNSSLDPDTAAVKYTRNTDLTKLTPTSTVFFLQETGDGKIEIYFGDGILGKAIENGNEIIVDYLVTDGPDANGANGFAMTSGIGSYPSNLFNITTVSKTFGGAAEESVESIKQIAPKIYKAQGRAVNADDYRAILLDKYGWIESINVWGGEDNIPQRFGLVFVSIKPNYGTILTKPVKDEILAYLDKFRIVGISPQIVDPDYIYVNISTVFKYNSEITNKTQAQLESDASTALTSFFADNIASNFDSYISYSKLLSVIDQADPAIVSNETNLTISKKFAPNTLVASSYDLDLANPIKPGTVVSKEFGTDVRTYQFKDDGNGFLDLYMDGVIVNSEKNKHTVDYTNGTIKITTWYPDINIGDSVEIEAELQNQDVLAKRNILMVEGTKIITSETLK